MLLVVEELFVVDAGDALVEVDLLARGGGHRDLLLEVVEQILVATRAVENAVDAAEGGQIVRVQRQHVLVAAKRFRQIVEVVLV